MNVPLYSDHGNILRQLKVFIIDEAPMILIYTLEATNYYLRNIMNSNSIFGEKIFVLEGGFRHFSLLFSELPLRVYSVPVAKFSFMSDDFHQMQLMKSMGTNANKQDFFKMVTTTWSGLLQSSPDIFAEDTMHIVEACIYHNLLGSDIFDNCTAEEMKNKVILSPKNSDCLALNEF